MLNPFPKEMSSYSTIQPSNTQISDSTDNRMEHMLLKMEDSQRQHQHTLLQVLHIVQTMQSHGVQSSGGS
eukprot:symbB.v1.2.001186.t1/scaffold50.1/size381796/1